MTASLTSAIPRTLGRATPSESHLDPVYYCATTRQGLPRDKPVPGARGYRGEIIRPHIGQLKVQCWRYAIIHDISFVE